MPYDGVDRHLLFIGVSQEGLRPEKLTAHVFADRILPTDEHLEIPKDGQEILALVCFLSTPSILLSPQKHLSGGHDFPWVLEFQDILQCDW